MENIKFMWNGIKVDGKLVKGWWLIDRETLTVTFHADSYGDTGLGRIFSVRNRTDTQMDYFDKDKVDFDGTSPFYIEALKAEAKQRHHERKVELRRRERRQASEVNIMAARRQVREAEERLSNIEALG